MVIVHIAPNSIYNEGFGYHENLLPKYQKRFGNTVFLIVPKLHYVDGKIQKYEGECDYINNQGIRVIRLDFKSYIFNKITNFFKYIPIYQYLMEIKPDMIFFHSPCSRTLKDVFKYKKNNSKCVLFIDNHLDIYNCKHSNGFFELIHKKYYSNLNNRNIKYVTKYYGVTPGRQTFLENYYKIPKSKIDLLIMGADDDALKFDKKSIIRNKIRKTYSINDCDFLIVTGGKIDKNKKVFELIDSLKEFKNFKFLIFGTIEPEIKTKIDGLCLGERVVEVGWVKGSEVYDYFYAADLIVFLGLHSVLWEQACASGTPCCFNHMIGFEHIALSNKAFLLETTENDYLISFFKKITEPESYKLILSKKDNSDIFLYSASAKKTIEDCKRT